VNIVVEVEGRTFPAKVDPKILAQNLVHKVAQGLGIDLPGWWHASVVMGLGDNHRYQEGDVIRLFPATTESIEAMRGPWTPKGSVAAIPKAIGGPPPQKKTRAPKEKRDWIQELYARGEFQQQDPKMFTDQLDVRKMITMTIDGGANPNPGPAGWGLLVRQNKHYICLWKHYEKSSNK
jgi:hypothetical protein